MCERYPETVRKVSNRNQRHILLKSMLVRCDLLYKRVIKINIGMPETLFF